MMGAILFVAGVIVGLGIGGAIIFYLAAKVDDDVFGGFNEWDEH
jgi:hypothetical protein